MTGAASGARRLELAELAAEVTAARGDAILVTGPGAISGALYVQGPDTPSIYNMELAYATPTAVGLALALPDRPVIAVEGDGSVLAGLGSLATIARYRPTNLTLLVVDNGIYGTGDNSVPTQAGIGADLVAVAKGLGWPAAEIDLVEDGPSLRAALTATRDGPHLIVARVDPASYGPSGGRPKPGVDVVESAVLLRRHLEGRSTPR